MILEGTQDQARVPIVAPARFYAADFSRDELERPGCSVLSSFTPATEGVLYEPRS